MCHLIFSVKYRKKILIKYGEEIKKLFYDIAEEKNFLNIIAYSIGQVSKETIEKYIQNQG
jgi:putative transposase